MPGTFASTSRRVAHLHEALELILHVVEGEPRHEEALGGLGGLLLVDDLLGLLDEADDVAHAEDALGHALRYEGLELVDLLAVPT